MTLATFQWLGIMVAAFATLVPLIFAGWYVFERPAKRKTKPKAAQRTAMATMKRN